MTFTFSTWLTFNPDSYITENEVIVFSFISFEGMAELKTET